MTVMKPIPVQTRPWSLVTFACILWFVIFHASFTSELKDHDHTHQPVTFIYIYASYVTPYNWTSLNTSSSQTLPLTICFLSCCTSSPPEPRHKVSVFRSQFPAHGGVITATTSGFKNPIHVPCAQMSFTTRGPHVGNKHIHAHKQWLN